MIKPLGDSAIIKVFEEKIDLDVLKRVDSLKYYINKDNKEGVCENVPSYNTLLVYYDPLVLSYKDMEDYILKLLEKPLIERSESKIVEIPVLYDGEDMLELMGHTGLSKDEVIDLHTSGEYTVYMLGFSPGFPYLGGMNPKLRTPRRKSPRLKISAGSVGIADMQTGVYSVDSPGGWQIIGRTPLKLFDIEKDQPSLLKAGGRLKFVAIDEETFKVLEENND